MNIKRFGECRVTGLLTEDEKGEYCLYQEYYLLEKDYNQLKRDNNLALDKLHEYRHMIRALVEG